MKIQPRIFGDKLTEKQKEQEERVFAAAKLLREHGYKAEASKYIVFNSKDAAAGIRIE